MGTQQQQRSTDQAFVTAASSVYATEVRKAINNHQEQLNQLEAAHEQLQQTLTSLEQLPNKLKHEIMVPMGKHAFFPGHLTRTNDITVHLGDQYYVEVTAGHARGILERKQAAVADGISKAQQQLRALQARLDLSADAVSGADEDPDAREIRSSLAESDALLASARKAKAAAAAGMQQGSLRQPQRITTASGYSYTRPQGPSTAQRSAQDHAEDIALQEKLQLLLLMEQQQELQDVLHDTPAQQQADIHAGMNTIQEGIEGSEDSELEDSAAGSDSGSSSQEGRDVVGAAAAGSAGHLSAVHRLQQLEAQSDSDDDEESQPQQPPPQQQQPSPLQPPAQQQQQQQQQQHQQRPQQQAQQRQQQQRPQQQQPVKPLKSALKKGFLGPAAPSGSNSSRGARAAGSSSSSRIAQAGSSSAQAAPPSRSLPAAFVGNIVERPTPTASAAVDTAGPTAAAAAATADVVGGVVERPAQAAGAAAAAPGSSGGKPMSKFKLRRLGLDPDAE
jgi:unconventional prefoldin RPB5 interactor 1